VDDKSFNQSAWEGVQAYGQAAGVDVKYIETKDQKDYAANIKQFVDEKYDVIVTVGFLMADATISAAKDNPSIMFVGVDQAQDPSAILPNLVGLTFEEDKAGFAIGALAAGMTQSGKIGAVVGTKSVPAVVRYAEGYKAGAAWLVANHKDLVKPGNVSVTLTYHPDSGSPFNDPTWGAQQTQSLIQAGNDIIFGGGGATGNGAVEAGAAAGIYVIGVDVDQYFTLPKAQPKLLSSATKDIKAGVFDSLVQASNGQLKGGNVVGPTGLAPFHDTDSAIPAALKTVLTTLVKGLQDGSIKTGVTA
jgi:basic membrane protein A